MKSSQEDITLLDAYLKGSLDIETTRALEARLATEQALSDDLSDLAVLVQGMRASVLADKWAMLKEWEAHNTKDIHQQVKKNNGVTWKWLLAIMAVFGITLIVYTWYDKKESSVPDSYKTLYADRFDQELILHKTMRAAVQQDSLSTGQRRAYELYGIQLFNDAIPLLDELWEAQKDTLALFYLGVSHVGIGEKEKGLMILKKPELSKYSKQTNLFINH